MTAVLSFDRVGKVTASRVASILCVTGAYQSRVGVLREMVRAAWDDEPAPMDNPDALAYGNEHEADAIAAYEAERGVLVHSQQMFVTHPDFPWLACTVDGLVGDDRLIEAKAPTEQARYYTVADKPIFDVQIRVQLACTGRQFGDLAVWRDGEPISISTVEHDPFWLLSVLPKLEKFHAEYQRIVASADLSLPYRFTGDALVAELTRQRDLARSVAAELEAENASLLATIADRDLAL